MSICACILVKTINVCKVYQVVIFMVDTVNDKMTVSFCYACKIEK